MERPIRDLPLEWSLISLIGLTSLIGLISLISLISLIGLIGLIGLISIICLIRGFIWGGSSLTQKYWMNVLVANSDKTVQLTPKQVS